jgi:uncharacterized repeat protein (TIGR03803 family)
MALYTRLLWAMALVLPAFGAQAQAVVTGLYSFQESSNGMNCLAGLVQGNDGSFYGTTQQGGTNFPGPGTNANPAAGITSLSPYGRGFGTVFKISSNGTLTRLHSFTGGDDGAAPQGGLVQGGDGDFYGTTTWGGGGWGNVFKMNGEGTLTNLHSFNINDGETPMAGLTLGSDGNLYGTTFWGGTDGLGTVFKMTTNGTFASLYSFAGNPDGADPNAGLAEGEDGFFYGTTAAGGTNDSGAIFKIGANGSLTVLYSFSGEDDGGNPQGGLVQGRDGNFYGTTAGGGAGSYGTVFKISTSGALTTLHSFTGTNDGSEPCAGLVQGSDGNFYGTTTGGGVFFESGQPGIFERFGTVFRISTNGEFASLFTFEGGNQGAFPYAGLVQGTDGSFYGTTAGGLGGMGTVFRLSIEPAFRAMTLTGNALNLNWSAEAGGSYQLQYSTDLISGNWNNLGNIVTTTGSTISATDSVTNGPQRFYRLVLSQ